MSADTIAAVASGAGRAGVGIVRASGPDVPAIARAITGRELPARAASYLPFLDADGAPLDIGIALRFEAPHSFTGEHVLELQGHGGPVVLDLVLARVLALGARPARPGEFSERAFLNDKLDLAQAEAVADLIESGSASAARAAVRALDGAFSAEVEAVVEELIGLRVWLEAALDFSEEEIDFLADPALVARAEALGARLDALLARGEQGQRLRDGLAVVIAGRPNVGKSSLLNALAGTERAIVSDIAGTTRDVLGEDILLDGMPLHVLDTAGLRESDDPVEREGVARARRAAERADHVLVVVDARDPRLPAPGELPPSVPRTLVVNKLDLVDDAALARARASRARDERVEPSPPIALSARTGEGLDALRARLLAIAGRDESIEGVFIARRRHVAALEEARAATDEALARLRDGALPELAAEELRRAQRALDAIVGRFDDEDLLGRIFSTFCVGK